MQTEYDTGDKISNCSKQHVYVLYCVTKCRKIVYKLGVP